VLKILFSSDRRVIDASNVNRVWEEISRFKALNIERETPEFVGIQDEHGRMILLALYDRERWVLETVEEDWGTRFGRIDLAKDFEVREAILTDEELKEALKAFVAEGRIRTPPKSRSLG